VIVATPTSTHFACAQCAVGVHLFVEKPLTLSPAESRALSELVIRRRRI
jgi:predicted dehydrogenase